MEQKKLPLVSVCLLVYNQADLLPDVILTITNQDYPNFEIIISDDCSTDHSWEVIKQFSIRFPEIRIIQTPENMGMAANTNFAVSHAKGKYIALLHHDDLAMGDLIAEWVNVAEKDEMIAFVFNDYLLKNYCILGDKMQATEYTYHTKENRNFTEIMDGLPFLKNHLLAGWGCPVRGTTLFRKKYFIELGQMYTDFGILADVDLWMRFSLKYKVGYVPKPLLILLQRQEEDYPEEYTTFSWKRRNWLYQIHGSNINRLKTSKFHKIIFQFRVNIDIIKQLLFLIKRRNKHFIIASKHVVFTYEFKIIKRIRLNLIKLINEN